MLADSGPSIGKQGESVVGVKLPLDPAQKRPPYLSYRDLKRDINNLPKEPANIAADYILLSTSFLSPTLNIGCPQTTLLAA